MEIGNLEHTDFETLFHGFEKAFADYEIHFEKEEVRSMLKRRGYNPRLSFAAFDNGEIVAFTLNGTGIFNGVPTAYDTGTGTVKQYRGQGIAGKIFTHSLPFLKESGISQYLLEVLQNNQKAIGVYRRMNFEVTREFDCFRQTIEHIDNQKVNTDCIIEQVDTDSIRQAQHYCDFRPSWQNNFESIERGISELTCLGAFLSGKMVGYCVFDIHTGDLAQIAVLSEYRRKRIASRLLQEAITSMKTDFIKILNISSDNPTMPVFLQSKNIPLASKQFEMILPL
ncbi:MAG: GNAT family N-acetyltransferase [Bacteroides sp.]|nr:GNAT family N-acetyltransferase [Bacteroides sp.]MCM1084863.1 GNAT family N-acetyltransferase [Bacteroides sp.]